MNILKRLILQLVSFLLTALFDLKLLVNITIEGRENIPKGTKNGLLIVSNHASYLDGIFLGRAFYRQIANLSWVVSKENYKHRHFKWFLNIYNTIVVNGTIEKVKKELKNNRWIVVFPEGGRRWYRPEELYRKKPGKGAATIALATGVSILPVRIIGSDTNAPAQSFRIKHYKPITVRIGKPFSFQPLQQEKIDLALLEKTAIEILNRIMILGHPSLRTAPQV